MTDQAWAVVLAGGEGTRTQSFIKQCLGFACPKQYFRFCGKRTMLEHTVSRAVKLVSPERVITVIGNGHRRYLGSRKVPGLVLEQPVSRGTGAGVFLPLAYILARDPEATILIFPSDHFVFPNAKFLEQVEQARDCAGRLVEKMILMAAVPDQPETDYGWIEPGGRLDEFDGHDIVPLRKVKGFREKPAADQAARCFERKHLWNTMIIATKARFLWALGKRLVPEVIERFERFHRILTLKRSMGGREEQSGLLALYGGIPAFDFSSSILTQSAGRIAVLPFQGVLWSDWGRPERVFDSLRRIGRKPRFLKAARRWRQQRGSGADGQKRIASVYGKRGDYEQNAAVGR